TMLQLKAGHKLAIWPGRDFDQALEIMATPIRQGVRTVGWLACGRRGGESFAPEEVKFQESAAAVVAIALRSVRLHRANQQALAHTVRLQEVAGMAGQGLESVAQQVAQQALPMLDAAGAACWAFDVESRVMATGWTEDAGALKVLGWSGRTPLRPWEDPPKQPLSSRRPRGEGGWTLIPLWYADRLVGAIGAIFPRHWGEGLGSATGEFAGHAAIAIENARLAEETRGRVQVLEAIAAFSDIDVGRPGVAVAELGRLVTDGLAKAKGALWLREGQELVCVSVPTGPRVTVDSASPLLFGQRRGRGSRQLVKELRQAGLLGEGELSLVPVLVAGQPAGLLSAELGENRSETRRLMAVLASQTGVALARVQLVEALDREAKTMDAVLSNSPLGVLLEGSDGRIDFANSAIERLYGIPVAELVGQTLSQLWQRAEVELRAEVDTESGERSELRRGERVIEMRRVAIPGGGDQPPRELTLHEDVTQERSVQEAKDLMLRAIGHEVRSPAAAMRATIASVLQWQERLDAGQQRSLLESAYDQSQRLLGLVESQLIIAQLETGRFQPRPEPVLLLKVAEETVGVLAHRYGERVRTIQLGLPPELPAVECEPTHLGQVLINLLGNALEYTVASEIRLTARVLDGQIEVAVTDNGRGVAVERIESLFSKLTPAGQGRARGGLGLGLYLCRLVVERSFGGRIWLERSGPAGTEFRFTLRSKGQ
ncbi:MAG: ATP-binding protein, partial [Candidatus Dormibacteraceae bacterium]